MVRNVATRVYADGVLIKFSRFAMVWLPDQALIEDRLQMYQPTR